MRRWGKLVLILLFPGLWFAGCDAPRDNPLDPGSSNYIPPVNPDCPAEVSFFTIKTEYIGLTHGEAPRSSVIAEANIEDPDGIDRVYLEIADTIRYVMSYDASVQHYRYEFKPEQTGFKIFNYVGAPFYLYIYDKKDHICKSDKAMITRVLADLPVLVWPIGGDISYTVNPPLVWRKYDVQFNVIYSVQVRTLAGSIRFEQGDIPAEQSTSPTDLYDTLVVDIALEDSLEYLWNIWVHDMLGNQTRSWTSRFVVQVQDTSGL